ncbi:MAG: hypothetical protein ACRDUY_09875 [Nitriliruptorales bacterium]
MRVVLDPNVLISAAVPPRGERLRGPDRRVGRHGDEVGRLPRVDPDATPEQLLTAILRRQDATRLAAHRVIEDSQREVTSLARLAAVHEDAMRQATEQWLQHEIDRNVRRIGSVADDPQWPALVARVRRIALDSHDPDPLLRDAIRMAPLDDARSAAAILHWRLGVLANP